MFAICMYIPEYGFYTCTISRFTSGDSSIALSGIHELKVTVREDQLLTWSPPPLITKQQNLSLPLQFHQLM